MPKRTLETSAAIREIADAAQLEVTALEEPRVTALRRRHHTPAWELAAKISDRREKAWIAINSLKAGGGGN